MPTALPILPSLDADTAEHFERDAIRRGLALAGYTQFDRTRPPVVLVHGTGDSPARLAVLAERLRQSGYQVLFALYDDHNTRIEVSAQRLAESIQALQRTQYGRDTKLELIGHSMGGIVSRACLNELQRPGSMRGRRPRTNLEPRAGFASIRLRTLDTPWDGYEGPSDAFFYDILGPIPYFIPGAMHSMRANSRLFQHLFSVHLEGVRFANIQAINRDERVRSISDLRPQERLQLIRRLIWGDIPKAVRLRNLCRSIEHDERFDKLRTALWSAIQRKELSASRADETLALIRVYSDIYPRFKASHQKLVDNREMIAYLINTLLN